MSTEWMPEVMSENSELPYNFHYQHMTEERWKGILQAKQDFIFNKLKNPKESPYLRPEVADSWARCRQAGLDPYQYSEIGPPFAPELIEQSKKENWMMIKTIQQLFQNFQLPEGDENPYYLFLEDKDGILLYTQKPQSLGKEHILLGKMRSEKVAGTTANSLCKLLKRPVQLQGPEHYFDHWKDSIVTTAPILDQNREISAFLALVQPIIYPPWDKKFQILCYYIFALASAMATAIENRIHLEKSCQQLENLNNLLNNTLAVIDEGIVTIDRLGNIINVNEEGSRILKLETGSELNRIHRLNIQQFLQKDTRLMSSVQIGQDVELEEIICAGNEKKRYLINIHPVLQKDIQKVAQAVLRLNLADKVNVQAAVRAGSTARFTFNDLIGESIKFKQAVKSGRLFSVSPENILLVGESGTGKELFAQAIHNRSRFNGPFMAVNCAAMPRELIESELFGYEGGSFTGADRKGRPGKIELSNEGTLFLDEIGDMPFELQAVLLRVLQDKQVMRVGGQSYKKVDFRVIAATNKDLLQLVEKELFRADLYYRLSVFSIDIPPLRKRGRDIEILCNYFIINYCQKTGLKVPPIHANTMTILNEFSWPGNVRQLENTMIYAVNMARGREIRPEHLPASFFTVTDKILAIRGNESKITTAKAYTLRDTEKLAIEEALITMNRSVAKAANLLDISKSTLYRKMKEYDISIENL